LHGIDKRLFAAGRGFRLRIVWEADVRKGKLTIEDLLDTGLTEA
jgi:hypothetical protein